ncbi:DUF4862 family protein [Thermodesulfobacteriota bacterium]
MNHLHNLIVGSYVSSISLRRWEEDDETAFYQELRKRPSVRGIEHGFYGTLHRYDDDWFLKNIDPEWDFVFITLPGWVDVMKNDDPVAGLAATDNDKRLRAVEYIQSANLAVKKLNAFLKRESVIAVQVHSTPSGAASKEAFAESLNMICSWDWEGAKIVVEHCDAFKPDGSHAKGYLPLPDEIWAIQEVREANPKSPPSMMLNWGRSTIEGYRPDIVQEHIRQLMAVDQLSGFIFSGVTASEDSLYGNFADKHTPCPTPCGDTLLAANSLMTEKEIAKTIEALPVSDLDYLGFKIMPLPLAQNSCDNFVYIDKMINVINAELQRSA